MTRGIQPLKRQLGAATLVVTVVVLLVSTIMVTFANRSIIFDIRSSANEARYREAFAAAEAGLDFASQRFAANFRASYNASDSTSLTSIVSAAQVGTLTKPDGALAGSGEAGFTVAVVDSGALVNGVPIFTVTATGKSADVTGTAVLSRQFSMVKALSGSTPNVPVVVGGVVGTGGNFNIVANPNGGNTFGAPISIWSNGPVTVSSSSATCQLQFYSGGQCSNPSGNSENISRGTNPATAISAYSSLYPDILPNSGTFPTDLFKFMFGLDRANWQEKKAQAQAYDQVGTSCSDLATAGANAGAIFPIWWIRGDCALTGGVIGSTQNPVILVVDDGAFRGSGNTQINGLLYLFDNPSLASTPSAALSGTMEIVGSLVSEVGGSAMSGSYSVKYDPNVISSFENNGNQFTFSYVPNSWRDF